MARPTEWEEQRNWDLIRRFERDRDRESRRVQRRLELPMRPLPAHARIQDAVAPSDRCYACDARAIGTRDRRAEGGLVEQACARHADTLGVAAAGVLNPPIGGGR